MALTTACTSLGFTGEQAGKLLFIHLTGKASAADGAMSVHTIWISLQSLRGIGFCEPFLTAWNADKPVSLAKAAGIFSTSESESEVEGYCFVSPHFVSRRGCEQ